MSKIDYRPTVAAPVMEQDIIVGGSCHGSMKEYVDSAGATRFHAGINIDVNDMFPHLIQGFGNSPDEAIKDALIKGHRLANSLYNGIDRMQFDMDIKISADELKKES